MALTLDSLQLYGAQESQSATDAQADVTSAPSQSTDEALITSLEAAEQIPLSGIATGIRLTSQSGYSSNPADALAEWVQKFESLTQPEQGDGWTLQDDERGRSVNVVSTSSSWSLNAGGPYEVQWELQLQRGQGVLDDAPRNPTSQTPNSTTSLTPDGGSAIDIGSVDEKRVELSQDVEPTPIAYGDLGDTVITPNGGTVKQVTISGTRSGTKSELQTWESDVRSAIGGNTQVSYQTGFPGTAYDVVISSFDPAYTGGQPGQIGYTLELIQGSAL